MKTTELILEGMGLRLRPVVLDDAKFIIQQRQEPRATRFLGRTPTSVDTQEKWITAQQKRKNDLYFICEVGPMEPVGTIGLYDISEKTAVWGRFVMSPRYNAAVQSLVLLFDYCFDALLLETVSCAVVKSNANARALYEWVGHTETTECEAPIVEIEGRKISQVSYQICKTAWRLNRPIIYESARRIQINRASRNGGDRCNASVSSANKWNTGDAPNALREGIEQ